MTLAGHNALVTGSGRSLGRAIAVRLAESGANIITNSRSTPDECEETAELCRKFGVKATSVVADVSVRSDVTKLAEHARREFGSVDILVNNVGISPRRSFLEITDEDWRTAFAANLDSMFYCCQTFIPDMLERKWGRILNITGLASRRSGSSYGWAHVTASKAGAIGLTRSLAAAYAPFGITCNEVAPATMGTEVRRNKYYVDGHPDDKTKDGMVSDIPMGRLGKPSEFAAACAFLASEEAAYITGQALLVNGGSIFI